MTDKATKAPKKEKIHNLPDGVVGWYIYLKMIFSMPFLGGKPGGKPFDLFCASKSADAQAAEMDKASLPMESLKEDGKTFFTYEFPQITGSDGKIMQPAHGRPCIDSYMVKGFFKEACKTLKRVPNAVSANYPAYIDMIERHMVIMPDVNVRGPRLPMSLPDGQSVTELQRMCSVFKIGQGRVTFLKCSESVPVGTEFNVAIHMLDKSFRDVVFEWLGYARFYAFGGWRTAGYGTVEYEVLDEGIWKEPIRKAPPAPADFYLN